MFQAEQQAIEQHIRQYCASHSLPEPGTIQWTPLPFSGEWGISTNFFPLAAAEARRIKENTGQGTNVPQLAQELASAIAAPPRPLSAFPPAAREPRPRLGPGSGGEGARSPREHG